MFVFLVILRFKIVAFDVWLEVSENQKVFLTLWRLRSGLGADELDCTSGSFPLSARSLETVPFLCSETLQEEEGETPDTILIFFRPRTHRVRFSCCHLTAGSVTGCVTDKRL